MKTTKISKLTAPELDHYRTLANFTDDEMDYFNMKARDDSNVKIAIDLGFSESKVSDLASRVKAKMATVDTF